jgi:hypothetical protein
MILITIWTALLPHIVLFVQIPFSSIVVLVLRATWYEPISIELTWSLFLTGAGKDWLSEEEVSLIYTNKWTWFFLSKTARFFTLLKFKCCKAVGGLIPHFDTLNHYFLVCLEVLGALPVAYSARVTGHSRSPQLMHHLTVRGRVFIDAEVAILFIFTGYSWVLLLFVSRKSKHLFEGTVFSQIQNILAKFSPTLHHGELFCWQEALFSI